MSEKRQNDRRVKNIKTEVHTSKGMTFSNSRNMSFGGIFISTPEPLNIGTNIELSLYKPDGKIISIKGIVRWIKDEESNGEKIGMGIEFIETSQDGIIGIQKILEP